jgi:hypothetical protein
MRRSDPHIVGHDPLDRGESLRDAADARAAVHSIDLQREFRHRAHLFVFDDTTGAYGARDGGAGKK